MLSPFTGYRYLSVAMLTTLFAFAGCGGDGGQGDDNNNQNANGDPDGGTAQCGNGQVEAGEECDDGENNSDSTPDACRSNCVTAFCGDGTTDTGEECDDGFGNSNTVPDACRLDCIPPACQDGVVDVEAGETCDNGPDVPEDLCGPD